MSRIKTSEEGAAKIQETLARAKPAVVAFGLDLLRRHPEWQGCETIATGQMAVDFVTKHPEVGAIALVALMEIEAIVSTQIDLGAK